MVLKSKSNERKQKERNDKKKENFQLFGMKQVKVKKINFFI